VQISNLCRFLTDASGVCHCVSTSLSLRPLFYVFFPTQYHPVIDATEQGTWNSGSN